MTFVLERQTPQEQSPIALKLFHYWSTPDGERIADFYRLAEGYLLRFHSRADFKIDLANETVVCVPTPGASDATISAIYANQVMPLLGSNGGEIVLHGSVVGINGAAVSFLGKSGTGKSTLAAAFAMSGYPFLSDDGLWIKRDAEAIMAMPNRPSIRLWSDSQSAVLGEAPPGSQAQEQLEKSLIEAAGALPFEDSPLPLELIFSVSDKPSDEVQIETVTSSAAYFAILRQSFILPVDDRTMIKRHFEACADLISSVPIFEISYPRRYEILPEVVRKVTEWARQKTNRS